MARGDCVRASDRVPVWGNRPAPAAPPGPSPCLFLPLSLLPPFLPFPLSLYLKRLIYLLRESVGARERGESREQVLHRARRWTRGLISQPCDGNLSQNQESRKLNRLCLQAPPRPVASDALQRAARGSREKGLTAARARGCADEPGPLSVTKGRAARRALRTVTATHRRDAEDGGLAPRKHVGRNGEAVSDSNSKGKVKT